MTNKLDFDSRRTANAAANTKSERARFSADSTHTTRPCVLIVDDQALNRDLLARQLESLGCDCDQAESGEAALAHCRRHLPDVVLMDCQMPAMDGFETARRIRALTSAARHVPIVALTAQSEDADRRRGEDAGMNEFLTKPVLRQTLTDVLGRFLRVPLPATPSRGLAPTTLAVIDTSVLDNIRALHRPGKPDLLGAVIDGYRESVALLVTQLGQAIHDGDPDAIRGAAHAIASTSANLGAIQVVALGRSIEAQATDLAYARANIENVGEAITRAVQELDRQRGANNT